MRTNDLVHAVPGGYRKDSALNYERSMELSAF